MKTLAAEFPPGLVDDVPFDTTKFVTESINEDGDHIRKDWPLDEEFCDHGPPIKAQV
jgi:hypothetical protein